MNSAPYYPFHGLSYLDNYSPSLSQSLVSLPIMLLIIYFSALHRRRVLIDFRFLKTVLSGQR